MVFASAVKGAELAADYVNGRNLKKKISQFGPIMWPFDGYNAILSLTSHTAPSTCNSSRP